MKDRIRQDRMRIRERTVWVLESSTNNYMPDSHNPLAEFFAIFIVPFLIIVGAIYFVCSVASCVIENEQPKERPPLSYKAGQVTRKVSANFIKGFFSSK